MKCLIAGLVLLLSFSAFSGERLLSYQFGEESQSYTTFPSDYYHLNKIELYDNSVMEISLAEVFYTDMKQMFQVPVFFHVQSIELTPYQMQMVTELIKELSVVPVTVTHRTRICEIVIDEYKKINHLMIRRNWDFQKQEFEGGLQLISTPTGCWMPLEANPKNHADAARARLLKLILQFAIR